MSDKTVPGIVFVFLLAFALLFPKTNYASDKHPGVISDIGMTVKYYVLDTWEITTSPTRINRNDALLWGGVLLSSGLIYAFDEEIFDAFHRNRENRFVDGFLEIGRRLEPAGHMGNTMKYYFGALGLSYLTGLDPLTRFFAELIESHGIAGMYKNGTNYAVGRYRPFEERGPYHFRPRGGTSFPSGHASNIFQVATLLADRTNSLPASVFFYTLATSVALERLDSSSHWPSDVWIGAAMGTAVARSVISRNRQRRTRVAPFLSPETETIGLLIHKRF